MQMNKRNLLWIAIVILFIVVLFISFKAGSGSASVNTAGQVASSANAMVGGC